MCVHQDHLAQHPRRQTMLVKLIVTSGTAGIGLAIIVLRRIIVAQRGFQVFSTFRGTVKGCKIAFCRFTKDAYLCR